MPSIAFIHLRRYKDGVVQPKGGYTVAIKEKVGGKYAVSLCQCNDRQRFDPTLGEKISAHRLSKGQFFIQDLTNLTATLWTLHNKLCEGAAVPLNLNLEGTKDD